MSPLPFYLCLLSVPLSDCLSTTCLCIPLCLFVISPASTAVSLVSLVRLPIHLSVHLHIFLPQSFFFPLLRVSFSLPPSLALLMSLPVSLPLVTCQWILRALNEMRAPATDTRSQSSCWDTALMICLLPGLPTRPLFRALYAEMWSVPQMGRK